MSRSGIVGSYGSSSFNILRSLHAVSHSGCTNLQSHKQCTGIPFSPHPHQHLLFLVVLIIAILTGDISLWFGFTFAWWLVMLTIFSCTCCPFVCLLWKDIYSYPLHIFFIWFFSIELYEFFVYLVINHLYIWFTNIFSHSVGCLFILLMISFAVQNLSSLM